MSWKRFINLKISCGISIFVILVFFVSGCASLIHVKKTKPHPEEAGKIVTVESVEILPPQETLPVGEKLTYSITWIGLPVGTITSHIKEIAKINNQDAYHIELTAQTNDFCSAIYKINDTFVTYMDTKTLLPLRHELKRQEGRHRKNYIIEYDHKNNKATYHNLIENWTRVFDIPKGSHDPLSAVYYFRTLDADVGAPIYLCVNMNEKDYEVSAEIEKKAIVEVPKLGVFDAFETKPTATLNGEPVKKGTALAYVSCDKKRIPLFGVVDVWVRLIGRVAITLAGTDTD